MKSSLVIAFSLLLLTHIKAQDNLHQTWIDPILLCNNEDFRWGTFAPVQIYNSNDFETCIKPFENISKVWFKFSVENQSNLEFELIPSNSTDDLDFVLFRSSTGMPGEVLRCMATGLQMDKSISSQVQCTGKTGLITSDLDQYENSGCSESQNNFLSSVPTNPGDEYFLLVTNYRSNDGFTLRWLSHSVLSASACYTNADKSIEIIVAPNPVNSAIKCNIKSKTNTEGTLRLISREGYVLENAKISISAGHNNIEIPIPNFSSGQYYLSFYTSDTQEIVKVEVIK